MAHAKRAEENTLLYEPGSRWSYANVEVVLLGKIVELASGRDDHAYVGERVFRPAGMDDSGFLEPGWVPDRFAVAYENCQTGDGVLTDPLYLAVPFGMQCAGSRRTVNRRTVAARESPAQRLTCALQQVEAVAAYGPFSR